MMGLRGISGSLEDQSTQEPEFTDSVWIVNPVTEFIPMLFPNNDLRCIHLNHNGCYGNFELCGKSRLWKRFRLLGRVNSFGASRYDFF